MSAAFYRSGEWRRLRAAVLARDPVCASRGCGRPAVHVDHVVPRSRGGADTLGNLRGACQSCHNRRSAAGNAPLRAIGCLPDGSPRDPADPWYAQDKLSRNGRSMNEYTHRGALAGEKSLRAGGKDRGGSRIRTKFPNGGGWWA